MNSDTILRHELVRPTRTNSTSRANRQLQHAIVFAAVGSSAIALFTANPLLTIAGISLVPILFALLWRAGEPPVLLFAAGFQWLQVFVPVLAADFRGETVGAYQLQWGLSPAAWLGLLTIAVLGIGMRIGTGKPAEDQSVRGRTYYVAPRKLAGAYFWALLIAVVLLRAGRFLPGIEQQLVTLSALRWVIVFLIGWQALRDRRARALGITVLFLELVIGFSGYFSGFRTILFLAIVLIASSGLTLTRILRPPLFGVLALTVLLGSFWQSVKHDYRVFLSNGERTQAIVVPILERFRFLTEQASRTSIADLKEGFSTGVDRLGYLEYFGYCIRNVPDHVAFQHGRLWREAIVHVMTPRVFFPDKAVLNDSSRTNEFSGVTVATVEEGTSVSIGYAAESYVDFGPVFMFVPIFILGVFWGWAYRWLVTRTRYRLLGYGVATTFILAHAIQFESSNTKVVGGALMFLIVFTVILKYADRAIWRFVASRGIESGGSSAAGVETVFGLGKPSSGR